MDTQLYDFVLAELEAAKGRWPKVANDSGVPLRTLEKIARKETKNPGVKHCQRLADYFKRGA